VGNYVYGDFDDRGSPWCADVRTGQVKWRRDGGAQGSGSACVIYADGLLYFRYQDGIMGLVDASPQGGFRQISSFKIPDGMKKSWAHPVVSGGLLYLRGKDKILCYDVRAPGQAAVPASVMRLWTDSTGRFKVEARLKGVNKGKAVLEKSDGSVFEISLDRLSSADQAYLRSL
jgi:outer membrane protein assembly factor BamB